MAGGAGGGGCGCGGRCGCDMLACSIPRCLPFLVAAHLRGNKGNTCELQTNVKVEFTFLFYFIYFFFSSIFIFVKLSGYVLMEKCCVLEVKSQFQGQRALKGSVYEGRPRRTPTTNAKLTLT